MEGTFERESAWLLKEKYNSVITPEYESDLLRLKNGEPLAYLIGSIPFLGTTIYLYSKPLIPRTETEFWVEKLIEKLKEKEGALRILDLCAGSGCIGVALQKAFPHAHVDFAELDASHHETIKKNLRENGLDTEASHIYGGDLFENVTETYDCIVSNPPYIDKGANTTDESVKDHEPHLALYGGEKGLEYLARIIEDTPRFLAPEGLLALEHEPVQAKEIQALASRFGFHGASYEDQFGNIRYSFLLHGGS